MTFKVDTEYSGAMELYYKISIGTGRTFHADNLDEVAYALQHYFRKEMLGIEHEKVKDDCPLCGGE